MPSLSMLSSIQVMFNMHFNALNVTTLTALHTLRASTLIKLIGLSLALVVAAAQAQISTRWATNGNFEGYIVAGVYTSTMAAGAASFVVAAANTVAVNNTLSPALVACTITVNVAATAQNASCVTNDYVIVVTNNSDPTVVNSAISDAEGSNLTCPVVNTVVCTPSGTAACPAAAQTIGNLTSAGIAISPISASGSVQLAVSI